MKTKCLLGLFASLALSGCITYSSEYANDGYYSSPGDSYYDDYGDNDGYYGNPGNYGDYSYAGGAYSNISISINFGGGYPYYGYYPSYYGYSQCSPWSVYCYAGHYSGYGWGYQPYYGYYPHQPRPPHQHPNPKPKPPRHEPDNPEQNAGQPGFHPAYPIVERPDGPSQRRQPVSHPRTISPQPQFGQTQPIGNGSTTSVQQYPRQQPRQRPTTLPVQDARAREDERYVEREAMPRQQPNYSQRPQQRARPVQSEDATNNYERFSQTQRNTPIQQGQAPRNRPTKGYQQTNGSVVVAQQMPQQQAQPRPQPERRERAESKPREPKAERNTDSDGDSIKP